MIIAQRTQYCQKITSLSNLSCRCFLFRHWRCRDHFSEKPARFSVFTVGFVCFSDGYQKDTSQSHKLATKRTRGLYKAKGYSDNLKDVLTTHERSQVPETDPSGFMLVLATQPWGFFAAVGLFLISAVWILGKDQRESGLSHAHSRQVGIYTAP